MILVENHEQLRNLDESLIRSAADFIIDHHNEQSAHDNLSRFENNQLTPAIIDSVETDPKALAEGVKTELANNYGMVARHIDASAINVLKDESSNRPVIVSSRELTSTEITELSSKLADFCLPLAIIVSTQESENNNLQYFSESQI